MSLFRDSVLNAVATVLSAGARLLITIGLARSLEMRVYGSLVALQWAVETAAIIAAFGLPSSMARYGPLYLAGSTASRARQRRLVLLWTAGSCLFALAAASGLCLLTRTSLPAGMIPLMLVWTALVTLANALTAVSSGTLRFGAVLASSVAYLAGAVGALALRPSKPDEPWGGGVWLTATFCSIAVNIVALALSPVTEVESVEPQPRPREVARFAANGWIYSVATTLLWTRGEFAVIQSSLSKSELALYAAATSLNGLINQSVNLLQGGFGPHLARYWVTHNKEYFESLVTRLTNFCLSAGLLVCVVVALAAPEIVRVFFGSKFLGSANLLIVLSVGAVSSGFAAANMAVQIETAGRFQRQASFFGACILILGAGIAVRLGGSMGAALVRACVVWSFGHMTFVELGRVGLREARRTIMPRWLMATALAICAALISLWFSNNLIARIVLGAPVLLISFSILFRSLDRTAIMGALRLRRVRTNG